MLVVGTALFLCLSGMLMAYVICADHMSEFFNGWNYYNDWEPFHGMNFIQAVAEIPHALYISAAHFPEACFVTLILYPLLVIFIAFVEVCRNEYAILLLGWLPFLAGLAIGIYGGFALRREPQNPDAGDYKF